VQKEFCLGQRKVTRLQTTHKRHQPDYVLLFTVLLLTVIGVITVFSASTVLALHNGVSASYFATRQLIAAILGGGLMIGLTFFSYKRFYQLAPFILLLTIGLLLLVLVPGVGKHAGGATRWIGTSSVHVQPSEIAIVSIGIYLAFFFTKKVTVLHSFKRGLRPAFLIIVLVTGLIFVEPDMGTSMTLIGTALVLVFASGIRLKPIILTVTALIPVLYLLAHTAAYRSSRMMAFFHPFQHQKGAAYQLIQGLTGIAAGGWFGRGFDLSVEKTGYLPIPYADFIFDVFTEEWGVIGAITLIVIFAVLIWRGFQIAKHASDRFGALLAIGLTSMIVIKTIINLGAVTWLLPVTGIPLPFISYGGTSLLVNMTAMGILLSISRETLDVAPLADELADVVYVSDVRSFQSKARKNSLDEVELFTTRRRATRQNSKGQVHSLNTWQARQNKQQNKAGYQENHSSTRQAIKPRRANGAKRTKKAQTSKRNSERKW
jgi:cell division protein FtsW